MTYHRYRRQTAHREAQALRRWAPAHWPHITADTAAHVALCLAHGHYVTVGDHDLPDPDREAARRRERESKRRRRAKA